MAPRAIRGLDKEIAIPKVVWSPPSTMPISKIALPSLAVSFSAKPLPRHAPLRSMVFPIISELHYEWDSLAKWTQHTLH